MGRMATSLRPTTLVMRLRFLLAAPQASTRRPPSLGEAGLSMHTGSAGGRRPVDPWSSAPRRRPGGSVDLEERRHGSNCSC